MEWAITWDLAGRLVVAAVLGAVIGLERELDDHPAGLRTFTTVAVGAALFGAISTVGFDEFIAERSTTNVNVEVTRVASQVVVGIGFLGAGLIFRRGEAVVNLTTAAGLWATAAVGLAAGIGNTGMAITATLIVALVLVIVPLPKRWLVTRYGRQRRLVKLTSASEADLTAVRTSLEAGPSVSVDWWQAEKHDGKVGASCQLSGRSLAEIDGELDRLAATSAVVDLERT